MPDIISQISIEKLFQTSSEYQILLEIFGVSKKWKKEMSSLMLDAYANWIRFMLLYFCYDNITTINLFSRNLHVSLL